MSSENEIGDGIVVVVAVVIVVVVVFVPVVGNGGSKTLGEMYGDCNAETKAEEGGDGELRLGEIEIEGENGAEISPLVMEFGVILMVNGFVLLRVSSGASMRAKMGNLTERFFLLEKNKMEEERKLTV